MVCSTGAHFLFCGFHVHKLILKKKKELLQTEKLGWDEILLGTGDLGPFGFICTRDPELLKVPARI